MAEIAYEQQEETTGEAEPVELDFEQRVDRLMRMIGENPDTRDRMLCEMYLAFTDMERHMRGMMTSGMFGKLMGRMVGKSERD